MQPSDHPVPRHPPGRGDRPPGGLGKGYHDPETRYPMASAVQREFIDLLLELDHERYADEVARGLHDNLTSRASP
ncbi:hypothetical protein GCM10010404_51820 [Nonomuraea africana]